MPTVKLITFVAFTIISVILLFIIAAACFPWREKMGPALLQFYGKVVLWIFGVRIDFADKPPVEVSKDKGILLIANHTSALDIFLMASLYRTVFLSKDEVRRYPLVGLAAALVGTLFIKRESPLESQRIIREIARNSSGRIITIFPQGTTSAMEERMPFKRGVFKTVELNYGTILLPVTIRYKQDRGIVWRKGQNLLDNLKSICAQKNISVKVTIHRPLSIADYNDKTVDEVCLAAQEQVFSLLCADY